MLSCCCDGNRTGAAVISRLAQPGQRMIADKLPGYHNNFTYLQ